MEVNGTRRSFRKGQSVKREALTASRVLAVLPNSNNLRSVLLLVLPNKFFLGGGLPILIQI